MLNKNKKAIAAGSVVGIILLILGFAIILFVYYQISWSGLVDREVCHESVVLRATMPNIAGMKNLVPLKCATQKMCVTSGFIGGNCEKSFSDEDKIVKIKVDNKEQIEKAIADEIVDCWSTMGEGKISLFSQAVVENYGVGNVYPTCVICSRIAFDSEDKLDLTKEELEDVDVLQYMLTHKVSDKEISYYKYLAGEGGKFSIEDSFKIPKEVNVEIVKEKVKDIESEDKQEVNPLGDEEKFDKNPRQELAVVFMQISAPENSKVIKNAATSAGIVWGAGAALAPIKTVTLTIKAATSSWFWAMLAVAGIYQQGNVAYQRAVTASYCGDISTGSEARNGCSVVRTVNYNEEDISKYCAVIESIP